jgi:hypothetical protein
MRANHPLVLLLGLLGLIPFLVCGYLACAWRDPADGRALFALIAYGAVILSFLGGVHWGFALAEQPGALAALPVPAAERSAEKARIGLGVLPSLLGWIAVLVAVLVPAPVLALCVLIVGFIAAMAAEHGAHRRGWMPQRYLWLRWVLTIVTLAILITTVVLRLAGARIIL